MRKLIGWLSINRGVNIVLLIIYFLLVVLPHEIIGRFIMNDLLGDLPRSALNSTVLIFSLIVFSTFLYFVIRNLIKGDQKRIKVIYLLITLGLLVVIYSTLFVLATEAAHFPQYALMAILLFPLTQNHQASLFWATILGVIDEGYQFFYLNPNATGYFDFNDIITDLLGATIGLLFLWSFEINNKKEDLLWYQKNTFKVGMGILLAGVALNILGVMSLYPSENDDKPLIILMSKVPKSFWSYDKVGDLYFHIVHPIEGIFIIIILLVVFTFLGRNEKKLVHSDF